MRLCPSDGGEEKLTLGGRGKPPAQATPEGDQQQQTEERRWDYGGLRGRSVSEVQSKKRGHSGEIYAGATSTPPKRGSRNKGQHLV